MINCYDKGDALDILQQNLMNDVSTYSVTIILFLKWSSQGNCFDIIKRLSNGDDLMWNNISQSHWSNPTMAVSFLLCLHCSWSRLNNTFPCCGSIPYSFVLLLVPIFSHENWPLAFSWPFCYAIVYREKGKLPRNPSAEGLCVYFA